MLLCFTRVASLERRLRNEKGKSQLWPSTFFCISSSEHDVVKIPRALFDRLVDTLAFTA
jgi:hypothetical protein